MPDYRQIPDDATDERGRITWYSFNAEAGAYDSATETDDRLERYWSFGDRYGLFDGDRLLSTITHIEFTANLRGAWVPLAGVSGVATPPEHRRRGLVAESLRASLADYRERGWPISALRPFEESFYAKYGWATGCRYRLVTVEPSALAPAAAIAGDEGRFVRLHPEDHERLHDAYAAWTDGVTLATRRSDDWWRDRIFHSYGGELYCYAWERASEVRGYLLYEVTDDRTLKTHEVAAADPEAYCHLLRFCHNHDSQVSEVELYGPEGEGVLDIVHDRDAITVEEASGQMVRIVDVPPALEAPPYPVDDAQIVLDVTDDAAPWNGDRFALSVRDGAATVERTDADPAATVDVGTLSQLLVGYLPVERARLVGDLTVHDQAAAETLAALFPTEETFLPETF
jgi:predicted acetyltransferase